MTAHLKGKNHICRFNEKSVTLAQVKTELESLLEETLDANLFFLCIGCEQVVERNQLIPKTCCETRSLFLKPKRSDNGEYILLLCREGLKSVIAFYIAYLIML